MKNIASYGCRVAALLFQLGLGEAICSFSKGALLVWDATLELPYPYASRMY